MTALGQSRRFRDVDRESALPPTTDIVSQTGHVRKVPDSDINDASRQNKKPPAGGSYSTPMIADQAAINAGFDFRRYAMNPTPAKPRIIMAQVEGSGTAATGVSAKSRLSIANRV